MMSCLLISYYLHIRAAAVILVEQHMLHCHLELKAAYTSSLLPHTIVA